jgi:hypothetical protein
MATNYTVRIIDRLLRFDTTLDDVVVTLLPFANTPNATYEIHRTSTGDGHTVTIQADGATADYLLPDGSTAIVLDDTAYTVYIKIPADGLSPAYVNSGGGSGSGGGGYVPPDAPAAVIIGSAIREVYNGEFEITVDWHAGTGAATVGVGVYLEDPDISSLAQAPMDGSVPLDGSSAVSGNWAPKRETNSYQSPALLQVPGQGVSRDVRVYLQAFASVKNPTLVRANKPSPTPSVVITVPPSTPTLISGEEYAWIVTGVSATVVNDFENAAGPMYHLTYSYTPPDPTLPLPPGLNPFGGV